MSPAHANKGSRRYFYYVSRAHITKAAQISTPRVSAPRLEAVLIDAITPLLCPRWNADALSSVRVAAAIRRAVLDPANLTVELDPDAVRSEHRGADHAEADSVTIRIPHDLARPASGADFASLSDAPAPRIDRALVRAVVLARTWADQLAAGDPATLKALAEREAVCPIYAGRLLPLAFLDPTLIETILDGHQGRMTLSALLHAGVPLGFAEQRALFEALR
jgi:hypothetical protein